MDPGYMYVFKLWHNGICTIVSVLLELFIMRKGLKYTKRIHPSAFNLSIILRYDNKILHVYTTLKLVCYTWAVPSRDIAHVAKLAPLCPFSSSPCTQSSWDSGHGREDREFFCQFTYCFGDTFGRHGDRNSIASNSRQSPNHHRRYSYQPESKYEPFSQHQWNILQCQLFRPTWWLFPFYTHLKKKTKM